MATNAIPSLHDDIFLEILPRLPVKSLLKFTSVSKSWLSLISSNLFIKTHLRITSKLHQRIMLNEPLFPSKQCNIESMFTSDQPLFDEVNMKYLFDSLPKSVSFVGSCDGLICVALDKKDLILWNPSTRKFKKLPCFDSCTFTMCGIGFDKHTDDYKVVVFFGRSNIVKVYSLRTNEWRTVGKFEEGKWIWPNSSVFANGKLYCVAVSNAITGEIVFFDFATEEYGVLKVQDHINTKCILELCASEECLYVFADDVVADSADVWMIRDYDLGKLTCTKLATIPNFMRPLVYVKNNCEILFQRRRQFGVFNSNDGTFRYLGIYLHNGDSGRALTYVESLVSPLA